MKMFGGIRCVTSNSLLHYDGNPSYLTQMNSALSLCAGIASFAVRRRLDRLGSRDEEKLKLSCRRPHFLCHASLRSHRHAVVLPWLLRSGSGSAHAPWSPQWAEGTCWGVSGTELMRCTAWNRAAGTLEAAEITSLCYQQGTGVIELLRVVW